MKRRQLYLMRNVFAFFVVSSVTLLFWDIFAIFLVAEKQKLGGEQKHTISCFAPKRKLTLSQRNNNITL